MQSTLGAARKDAHGNGYSSIKWYKENFSSDNAIFLDANTDIGKLIELLEKPPAPTPPTIHGHTAQYYAHSTIITFGCAKIPVELIRKAYDLTILQDNDANRMVFSITLTSGKILSALNLYEILNYVNEVNKP